MNNTSIGIIGGAGPMAGALLFQMIIRTCQDVYGCQKDADFPKITLLSYPFADMLLNPLSDLQQGLIQEQLSECFATLQKNEIKTAAIACNTLHAFLQKPSYADIEFVDMLAETGAYIRERQLRLNLILCTGNTVLSQLHMHFFECAYCDTALQSEIDTLIDKILAGKQTADDAKKLCNQLNQHLIQKDQKEEEITGIKEIGLVLGCTEFSVLNEQFPLHAYGLSKEYIVLDPNHIVAEKLCQLAFKQNQETRRFQC